MLRSEDSVEHKQVAEMTTQGTHWDMAASQYWLLPSLTE